MNDKGHVLARWEPRKFGAAEAERITGVSQHIQRDWRRRKLIGRNEETGRIQYRPEDLATLAFIQAASRAGLTLTLDGNTLYWGTLAITNAALRVEGAIEYGPSVPRALISSIPEYFHLQSPPKLMLVTNFASGAEIVFEFLEELHDLRFSTSGDGLQTEESFLIINFEAIGRKLAQTAACPLFDVLEVFTPPGANV